MAAKNIIQFLQEVHSELNKVIWPKRDELFESMLVVLIIVCVFAIYLGSLDVMFSFFARAVFRLYGG